MTVRAVANQYSMGAEFVEGGDLLVLRYQQDDNRIDVYWETHTSWANDVWCASMLDLPWRDSPETRLHFKLGWRASTWNELLAEDYELVIQMLKQPPATAWLVRGSTVTCVLAANSSYEKEVVYDALGSDILSELKNWPAALQDYLAPLHKATKQQHELMRSVLHSAPGVYLLLTYETGKTDWDNVSVVRPGQTHRTLHDVFSLFFPKQVTAITHKLCPLNIPSSTNVLVLVRECPDLQRLQWDALVGKPALVAYDLTDGTGIPVSVQTLPQKLQPLVALEPSMLMDIGTDAGDTQQPICVQKYRPMLPVDVKVLGKLHTYLHNNKLYRSLIVIDANGPLVDILRWLLRTKIESFRLHVCAFCDESGPSSGDWFSIAAQAINYNMRQVLVEHTGWVIGCQGIDVHPLFDADEGSSANI